jgi:transposase
MNITTPTHRPSIFVGLDVHKDSINLAALAPDGKRFLLERVYPTENLARLRKDLGKLAEQGNVFCCYEASSAGFVLWRKMLEWGVHCQIAAPSLIPKKVGLKRKNDRIDARHMAEYYRSGLLSFIHVPSEAEEAVRDLLRCRATINKELKRSKCRVVGFLQRRGHVYRLGKSKWTLKFLDWVNSIKFESEADQMTLTTYMELVDFLKKRLTEKDEQIAKFSKTEPYEEPVRFLRSFRGIETQAAMTFVTELGDVRRFGSPKELMSFLGLVPSEHSSGCKERRGPITKTGNSFCRHVLMQAAWCYRFKPAVTETLRKRTRDVPEWVSAHSWKAQKRLHSRLQALQESRNKNIAVVAVARELAGFLGSVLVRLAEERKWDYGCLGCSSEST